MEPFETFESAGFTVELHYDEHGGDINPRKDYDHTTKIVQLNRDYLDPDESPELFAAIDALQEKHGKVDDRVVCRFARLYLDALAVEYYSIWCDRDQLYGYAYVSRQAMIDAGWTADDITPEKAQEVLDAELAEYEAWLRGEVYGYVITDPETGEQVESCWGFIGEDPKTRQTYAESAARDEAAALAPIVAANKAAAKVQAHLHVALDEVAVAKLIAETEDAWASWPAREQQFFTDLAAKIIATVGQVAA